MKLFGNDFDKTLIIVLLFVLIGYILYLENQSDAPQFQVVLATLLTGFTMIVAFHFKGDKSNGNIQMPHEQPKDEPHREKERFKP